MWVAVYQELLANGEHHPVTQAVMAADWLLVRSVSDQSQVMTAASITRPEIVIGHLLCREQALCWESLQGKSCLCGGS